MRKTIFRWLKIILLIYAAAGIALFYLQEKLLFHPEAISKDASYHFNDKHEEFFLPVNATDTISVVRFFHDAANYKGAVIYFHGNRRNVEHYAKFVTNFTKQGYDVWMMDYAGFGKSTGKLSEQKLYADAKQVYKLVHSRVAADSIIIYGKSLGTGIAAYTAANNNCKRLMLETPYYSVSKLASYYFFMYPFGNMSKYKIPTYKFLQDVKAPVTIFHGTEDGTVPYTHAKLLEKEFKPGDELISIKDGEHNNLNDFKLFHQKLDSLLKL